MAIHLTAEELQATAQAINAAWESGSIRGPELAFHLLRAANELKGEFDRLQKSQGTPETAPESEGANGSGSDEGRREEVAAAFEAASA